MSMCYLLFGVMQTMCSMQTHTESQSSTHTQAGNELSCPPVFLPKC